MSKAILNRVIRRGDYSPRSSIGLVRNRYGITIRCNIDPERCLVAPNPEFCGAEAGGRSLATYEVLWQLCNELPTDERKCAFLSSKYDDGSQFLIFRTDGVIVATEDANGEYGAKVFVGKDSPFFSRIKELFQAIESDNKKEPLGDALAHPYPPVE